MKLRFLVVLLHSILRWVIPCSGPCFQPCLCCCRASKAAHESPLLPQLCWALETGHVPGNKWNTPLEAMWFEERKDDLWWLQAGMVLCPLSLRKGRGGRREEREAPSGGRGNSTRQAVLWASATRAASRCWSWLPGLLNKALGARPGVPKPCCWEKIWEAYASSFKLAPVSQDQWDFMAKRRRCGQCRQSVTYFINFFWAIESEKSEVLLLLLSQLFNKLLIWATSTIFHPKELSSSLHTLWQVSTLISLNDDRKWQIENHKHPPLSEYWAA